MRLEGLDDLVAHPHHRVERGHRLLEDHADLAAAQVLHRLLVEARAGRGRRAGSRRQSGFTAFGSSPITAWAIIDLPEPDSPTTHSVSPGAIVSETSSTAMRAVGQRRQGERQPLDGEDGWLASFITRAPCARRGLSASFSPSPTRLSASTVRKIARPGKKLIHQASSRRVRPAPDHVAPAHQVGSPRPRKESEDSSRIAEPTISEPITMIGDMVLGSTWLKMMRGVDWPMVTAACTYSRVLSDRTSPRTSRATGGHDDHADGEHDRAELRLQDRDQHDGECEARNGLEELGEAHQRVVDEAAG